MERVELTNLRKRISWASIFGGVITVLAISSLLAILGSSIGLFMFDPQSANPVGGIGTTIGIWTILSLLISMVAGGFVAGKLAGEDGMIHGFLVWATSLIVAIILGVFLAVGTVKATFNILGSISSVTGNIISGVGGTVKDGISGISDQVEDLFGNIDFDTNTDRNDMRQDIRMALRKSGVREFQPEYLRKQIDAVKSDLNKSVKRIARNPNNADMIANDFLGRLQNRVDNFSSNIDKEDLVKTVANNSNLSRQQAEETVDEYIELTNNAVEKGKEQLAALQQSVEQAKQEWNTMKQNALEEADKASNAAARSALFSFFGILIGAVLSIFAGSFGVKKTRQGYDI